MSSFVACNFQDVRHVYRDEDRLATNETSRETKRRRGENSSKRLPRAVIYMGLVAAYYEAAKVS
jgi:hypothetical protein